ncbi:MAG: helicase [Rhodomicrobium sp.]|nr:MAG: helicase [Rhodomicrobium sp.]
MAFTTPASDLYGVPGASNVTAVLGPTNTGKTHLAIERMLGHDSGLIGLPLRLLAREVYDRIVARIGPADVALITGEEKIKPKNARYWVSTVEAMPREIDVDFVAIDEIQLAADPERGHVFTDRLFHARGKQETLLLGAETMRTALSALLPGVNFISRPRLSKLSYAGPKKISRLPRRSAIVAFSANDVYSIGELIRRQRGGAAVVLGALSPRTRNAQVEMFQSGEVDFLVATDAIGMGLNLDVHHVAFAGNRKFDGAAHRELFPAEAAQIAGRAGRHIKDGTFGVTGDVPPFTQELIDRIEDHDFDPVGALQWRARSLDFASVPRLLNSLKQAPDKAFLMKARDAGDVLALETLARDTEIERRVSGPQNVQRLWDCCQIPDYRKIGVGEHTELVKQIHQFISSDEGYIPDEWMHAQIDQHDRIDGDIDTIAQRIAHIRTWTFVANRVDWLQDPAYWQERSREIENNLSDALHQGLTKRFVDRRTSLLMKRLRDRDELFVEIDDGGQLYVEDHLVGSLSGFHFVPDDETTGTDGRATRAAAAKVLVKELTMRSEKLVAADRAEFSFTEAGEIIWQEAVIGRLSKGEVILKPQATLVADESLSGPAREDAQAKLQTVCDEIIAERLAPLVTLANAEEISGLAKGVAFQLTETLGILLREPVAQDIRELDQDARSQLRKYGVRFGAFNIYFPLLLKPAATEITRLLWLLFHEKMEEAQSWELPRAGLTSAPRDAKIDKAFYRASGFHTCGNRVVRVDMLERLADQIRGLVSWRTPKAPPKPAEKTAPKAVVSEESAPHSESGAVTGAETDRVAGAAKTPETEATPEGTTTSDAPAAQDAETVSAAEVTAEPTKTEAAKKPVQKKSAKAPADEAPQGATGDGGFIMVPDMMSIMGCSADELAEVLEALGFRRTVKRVKDDTATPPLGADKPADTPDAAMAATKDTASVEAPAAVEAAATESVAGDKAEVKTEVKAEAESADATVSENREAVGADDEFKEIIIWRPARRNAKGRPAHNQQGRSKKHSKGQHGKPHKGARNGSGPKGGKKAGAPRHNGPRKPIDKPIDPDSPFAKLQALKAQIENKAG